MTLPDLPSSGSLSNEFPSPCPNAHDGSPEGVARKEWGGTASAAVPAAAHAGLPLFALRTELIDLARETTCLVAYVGDMARWRKQPSDLDVCHWLDALIEVIARVESRATLVRHIIEELRDRALSHPGSDMYVCVVCHGDGEIRFNRGSDPQAEDVARCSDCGGRGELDRAGLDRVLRGLLAGDRDDPAGDLE